MLLDAAYWLAPGQRLRRRKNNERLTFVRLRHETRQVVARRRDGTEVLLNVDHVEVDARPAAARIFRPRGQHRY